MLDQNLKAQLQAYLEKVVHPIELRASLDASPKSAELEGLLQDIASLDALAEQLSQGYGGARLDDIVDFRIALETQTAVLAAQRGTEATLL